VSSPKNSGNRSSRAQRNLPRVAFVKGVPMQSMKLTVLLSALALGVAASAGAQTVEIIEAPVITEGQVVIIAPAPQPMADPAAADRKSTRLKSSHLGISYAVFCL